MLFYKIMRWKNLANCHQSKVVKQSYIWLLLVPVVAKLLSKAPGELTVHIFNQNVTLNFVLPFTWRIFYSASIFFAISNIIYKLCCPEIIKDHTGFSSFLAEGKGPAHLENYECEIDASVTGSYSVQSEEMRNPGLNSRFWSIYERANEHAFWARLSSFLFLVFGIVLVFFIAAEGFFAVVWES